MAEKKTNSKVSEKNTSTLDSISEKTTKPTKAVDKSSKKSEEKQPAKKATKETAVKKSEAVATEKAKANTTTKAEATKAKATTVPKAEVPKAKATTAPKAETNKDAKKPQAKDKPIPSSTAKAAEPKVVSNDLQKPKAPLQVSTTENSSKTKATAALNVAKPKSKNDEVVATTVEDNKRHAENSASKTGSEGAKSKGNANINKPLIKSTTGSASGKNKLSLKDRLAAFNAKNSNNQPKIEAKSNNGGNSGGITAILANKRNRVFAITAVALLLVIIVILSVTIGVLANTQPTPSNKNLISDYDELFDDYYDTSYKVPSKVGYHGKILGYVHRNIPREMKNEGLEAYPRYGYTLNSVLGDANASKRKALIDESIYLTANGTWNGSSANNPNGYDRMDKDGYLYLGENPTLDKNGNHRQLYKHTTAEGMYYGNVSDDEPGIVKQVTMRPRSFQGHGMYNVTGVYAPAGEVIKIQISEEDMEATGGIAIHIGQALYNGKANNIWVEKGQMQRFPVIMSTMQINKSTATLNRGVYTAYVGSYVGGPLYIRNENVTFSATISGGVAYSHFILGYTTPEEFERNKDSSAPYFDMEIWDNGMLHSGPKKYADQFSYNDLYKAAVLWDKVATVTTYKSNQNIVFIYDPFVAAGAAVAFPGQYSVNCPAGWMASSLNYNTLIKSGAWGNFHEYHHNFQGFGVGDGGEVTNNALTLVSYSLFTKISANRRLGSYGAEGLGGWNSYTSATYALDQVLRISDPDRAPSNGNRGLALYATLLHNFGQDAFMKASRAGGGQSYQNYFLKWQNFTHYNMTYYFKKLLHWDDSVEYAPGNVLTDEWINTNANNDYPMFVPVSSIYQTGRVYEYTDEHGDEKRSIKTMRPYLIPYGQDFIIDLREYKLDSENQYESGSVVVPKGITYKVKKMYRPENGTLVRLTQFDDGTPISSDDANKVYKYTPGKEIMSGEIHVILEIKGNFGLHGELQTQDVELILELEQSHDLSGRMLERTEYNFETAQTKTDAAEIFNNQYAGYVSKYTKDNKNSTQNTNADVWLTADERAAYNNNHSIIEISGKFYIDETAKYRFMLRGRGSTALFISKDNGATYEFAAKYNNNSTNNGFPNINNFPESYIDLELPADSWLYIKLVFVPESRADSFIGLGMGKFTPPMPQVDGDGNPLYDENGNPLPDIPESVRVGYSNAYRNSFKFDTKEFVEDYFYSKTYKDSYTKSVSIGQSLHGEDYKYLPWDNTPTHYITNLFDDDDNTFIHTNRTAISDINPFEVSVKLDNTITANNLIFYGSTVGNGKYSTYLPKNFKVYISTNGETWKLVSEKTNATAANYQVQAAFDDTYKFNYYKVQVTATHARNDLGYLTLNKIGFSLNVTDGDCISPDDNMFKYSGNWRAIQTYSSFGHSYIGRDGASMSFDFEGKYVMIKSTYRYDNDYEVYIDGVKVDSLALPDTTTTRFYVTYMSPMLSDEVHNITIKCIGETTIDSIITFRN